MRTRSGRLEPEIYFRMVHVAGDGHHDAPVGAYREQTVEFALDPKGAFEYFNIGTLTLRVATNRVVRLDGHRESHFLSRTSRTFLARVPGPNGFARNGTPAIKTKDSCTALAVYPLIKITLSSGSTLCMYS